MTNKPKAIITDFDLTIADGRHRHHLLNTWLDFVNLSIHDPKFDVTLDLIDKYRKDGYKIIILTARDKSDHGRTVQWLEKHNISVDELFMKEIGDNRPDEEAKLDLYHKEIEPYYDVEFLIDDKEENCRLFSDTLGIPAFKFCYTKKKGV